MNKSCNELPKKSPNNFSKTKFLFFNTCFDKNQVKDLVSWFLNKYGEKQTISFLESLKDTGFYQATRAGISLGIEDLEIPPEKPNLITDAQITTNKIEQKSASGSLTSVEKSQYLIDTWNQTSDLLRQNAIQNFKSRNVVNPVYMMAFSGARGNISQVRQLVAMRGLMADPQGAILEFPIQSNFREGLTITEYLISCYGARKGLVDTALRTATSGYLTRRLVDCAQHAVISIIDCGTKRSIVIEGKNLENRLIGRVLAKPLKNTNNEIIFQNEIISTKKAKLISKNYSQVLIRSPLTCEATTSVCQFCYGWNLASGKLVQIGEAVGVIAAQSIGEPGTQLTMRTFHTGGVGVFSDQALKPIISPYKGKIIFYESIPGHFVRTPHGQIVYMIKYLPKNPNKILFKIESAEKVDREFIIREQDLPPGSLIFVKNGEFINSKQLLAQASHLKLTKQRLPESSHPVYSPLEGQIFFESMNLFIEKEIFNNLDESKKTNISDKYFSSLKNLGLPDTRRMAKIGSFWVLAGYNQQEFYTTNTSFLESGDLVSKNTILYNYLFSSLIKTQLYKIKSHLAFGINSLQIPIEKISFTKKTYQFTLPRINEVFVLNKKTNNLSSLFWYPFRINKRNDISTKIIYTYISPFYLQNFCNEKGTNLFVEKPIKGNIFRINQKSNFILETFTKKRNSKILIKNVFSNLKKNSTNKIFSTNFTNKLVKSFRTINFSNVNKSEHTLTSNIKKLGWLYVPCQNRFSKISPLLKQEFFPAGTYINNICFPKSNVSLKFLSRLKNLTSSYKLNDLNIRNWYFSKNFLTPNNNFLATTKDNFGKKNKSRPLNVVNEANTTSDTFSTSYHECARLTFKTNLGKGLVWYKLKNNFINNKFSTQIIVEKNQEYYISLKNIIIIQTVSEYTIPRKKDLQFKISKFNSKLTIDNPNNILFSKQLKNSLELKLRYPFQLKIYYPLNSGYLSVTSLIRINFKAKKILDYSNIYFQYQNLSNNFCRGLNLFQYFFSTFKNPKNFSFQTYLNNWVLPGHSFSIGNVHIKTSGEFRNQNNKSSGTILSILRTPDCLSFNLKTIRQPRLIQIGKVIRWGEEIVQNIGCEHNGQILKKNKNQITIRLGVPILASSRGIIHVFQNDLVEKNQLLITLKSRRLQTEDIVQGIPKIEQLFEARESQGGEILSDTVHIRLRNAFVRELELLQSEHWSIAVQKSFVEAQQFLVQNIVDAYGNQGVKISEKHVEVIVRQMTSRVRILEAGETGLLPGELVQHTWIQNFNKQIHEIGLREATYEPIVLGISKSVLQSESFLLAASFQEVSRVLVRSALSKKRDFLRGLHENVIVGQLIPGGTGLITQINQSEFILTKFF